MARKRIEPTRFNWRKLGWRPIALFAALFVAADPMIGTDPDRPNWNDEQVAQLLHLAHTAPEDGLPEPDTSPLEAAARRGQPGAINQAASALALQLAQQHLLGVAPASERVEWYIVDTDSTDGLPLALSTALKDNRLPAFFDELKPSHADYAALRSALAYERDPVRQQALVRTMDRWRWLPHSLGDTFILANAAGFEVNLWRGGEHVKRWAAISGKPATQTPSLMAEASAVNFNPWWEVPDSIAKESGMRAGGRYVWSGTHFRQPPGPGNALGRVKVIMPNRHNIYLHDTPSRSLFGAQMRAFSHGCMRVDDALGFAATLLEGTRSRTEIDKLFKAEPPLPGQPPRKPPEPKSTVVPLAQKIPVYVTYMTVTVGKDGTVAYHKDIYGRDARLVSLARNGSPRLALQ